MQATNSLHAAGESISIIIRTRPLIGICTQIRYKPHDGSEYVDNFCPFGVQYKSSCSDLAVIFRPGIISHPDHELSPEQHKLSQDVLEFLIAHQDWFMLDMPPPPRDVAELSPFPKENLSDSPVMISPPSSEDLMGGRGRERDERRSRRGRRRATSAAGRASRPSSPMASSVRSSSMERPSSPPNASTVATPSRNVVRSRTMPARPRNGVQGEERPRNVLKKKAPRANGPSIIKVDVPSQQ